MRGKFITFEGDDGVGKSTQARHLQAAIQAVGLLSRLTREPGGSNQAEQIRHLLLNQGPWSAATQVHLFSAARQDHVENLIEPHLAAGYWVVCDRYYDSMVAKLIVHAPTRIEAINRLRRSLDEFAVAGIQTTIPLHRRIVDDPSFQAGDYTIHWLERFVAG